MTVKPETIFGQSKGITFSLFTLNQELKLFVPNEESFPIPLRHVDVARRTNTAWDVLLKAELMIVGTLMTRNLSEHWTGFTQFTILNEKPPHGCMSSGGRLTNNARNHKA